MSSDVEVSHALDVDTASEVVVEEVGFLALPVSEAHWAALDERMLRERATT